MNYILISEMFSPVFKDKVANFTDGEKCIAGNFDSETMKRAYVLRELGFAERR